MQLPRIVISLAAGIADRNKIGAAMGLGSQYFSGRKLCAIDPNADHTTPATHYGSFDSSAQLEEQIVWQNMAGLGGLPPIAGIWGEDGVISSQDAQAVIGPSQMEVFTKTEGPTSIQDWTAAVLAGAGLQFVPDEPL